MYRVVHIPGCTGRYIYPGVQGGYLPMVHREATYLWCTGRLPTYGAQGGIYTTVREAKRGIYTTVREAKRGLSGPYE